MNTAEFLRTAFFIEHIWWLLLLFESIFNLFRSRDFAIIVNLEVESFPERENTIIQMRKKFRLRILVKSM